MMGLGWRTQGVTSWSVFYLMKEKGVADVGAAATRVAGLELGGLLGSLVAGRLSDWLIKRSNGGAVGQRVRVVMGYLVGVAASLLALKACPASSALLQVGVATRCSNHRDDRHTLLPPSACSLSRRLAACYSSGRAGSRCG